MDKNFKVVKSNNLVEAFTDMTVNECKVVSYLISKIKKEDENFNIQSITVKDFNNLLSIEGSKSHTYLKNFEQCLLEKTIRVLFSNGDRLGITWFSYIKYINKESTLEVCFNPNLKEHLLALKRDYTQYRLDNICSLNSSYSIRIYEILKRYEHQKKSIIVDLEELKTMLGVKRNYKQYHDFKRKVLLTAQGELKKHTDISFEFGEIKRGRKIVEIKFIIKSNIETKKMPTDINDVVFDGQIMVEEVLKKADIDNVVNNFRNNYNLELNYNLVKKLIEIKGIDCVMNCVNELKNYVRTITQQNFFDFTIKYGTDKAYTKTGIYSSNQDNKPPQMTNYEQREYDDNFFNSLYDNIKLTK